MSIAETEVTITGGSSGSPQYVYASHTWGTNAVTIPATAVSSYPETNATTLKWPLYAAYLDGGVATLAPRGILNRGDLNLVSPI